MIDYHIKILNQIPLEIMFTSFLLECGPEILRAVYYSHLTNNFNVVDFLNRRPNVVTRFNDAILKATPQKKKT